MGEGLTEAEIISWLVAVGDHVDINGPVVEIETAKSSGGVAVPVRRDGDGDPRRSRRTVTVGTVLITIEMIRSSPKPSDDTCRTLYEAEGPEPDSVAVRICRRRRDSHDGR